MIIKMFSKIVKVVHIWYPASSLKDGYTDGMWYRIVKKKYVQPHPFLWIGIWFHLDGYEHPHSFEQYELESRWADSKHWSTYKSSCGIGEAFSEIAEEIERLVER